MVFQDGLQYQAPIVFDNLIHKKQMWLSNVALGGPDLNILYVTCGDKVYRRPAKTKGVLTWRAPIKPPRPRL